MHPALQSLLTETILHAAHTGRDAYGAPLFGLPVTRKARIEYVTRRFRNVAGEEMMSRAIVYVDGAVVVGLQDKMTLNDGTSPKIQRVDTWTDPTTRKVDHRKIFF